MRTRGNESVCHVDQQARPVYADVVMSGTEFYRQLGQRIARARKLAGLTQEELGKHVGLSRTSITNLEAGRQPIQAHTLFCAAKVLKVGLHGLLPEVADPEPELPENTDDATRNWLYGLLHD